MKRAKYQTAISIIAYLATTMVMADYQGRSSVVAINDGAPVKKEKPKTVSRESSPPALIVKNYLDLAARGAHLTDEGRSKLERISGYSHGNVQITIVTRVISGYRIHDSVVMGNTATVVVEFDEVGSIVDDFYTFKPRRQKDSMSIKLTRKDEGGWKIETALGPHMFVDVVIEHMENRYKTDYFDKQYKKAIQQIREAAKQPLKN